ncbi:contact-dependent growth inhibition system immunity protein [Mucilaginibacter sp.]|jgi:hypothetical protein|uniref:contact-dependent growth inhibition system immunity protein n=1 Tax=Mucilaginibacter sp. TaxID=1882438 RepID=UPI003569936C
MENNWKFKSLQNLEKGQPIAPGYSSHLIKRCTELFNRPLNEYSIEDMRVMIGQQVGLNYLIPLALEQLKIDILSEGDYYSGDLLTVVLKVDKIFWSKNGALLTVLAGLIESNKDLLLQSNVPLSLLEGF